MKIIVSSESVETLLEAQEVVKEEGAVSSVGSDGIICRGDAATLNQVRARFASRDDVYIRAPAE